MKNVIISGGCGLLGQEFAKTLAQEENRVFVFDLMNQIQKSKDSGFLSGDLTNNIFGFGVDVTSEYMVQYTIKYIYEVYGSIDILVNAAAINPIPKEGEYNIFENYPLEKWKNSLDVNLTGSFLLSRECIKYMLKNKIEKGKFRGTIVNIASELGIIAPDQDIYDDGYIKPPDYCISKAGLIHLTKYIASYYGNIIKSVCLIPGSVETTQSENLKIELKKRTIIGRLAKINEYNKAIGFLCSEGSDFMQGQNLVIDGGRSIL